MRVPHNGRSFRGGPPPQSPRARHAAVADDESESEFTSLVDSAAMEEEEHARIPVHHNRLPKRASPLTAQPVRGACNGHASSANHVRETRRGADPNVRLSSKGRRRDNDIEAPDPSTDSDDADEFASTAFSQPRPHERYCSPR
eukprot:3990532-Prymnesium_polylepis.1